MCYVGQNFIIWYQLLYCISQVWRNQNKSVREVCLTATVTRMLRDKQAADKVRTVYLFIYLFIYLLKSFGCDCPVDVYWLMRHSLGLMLWYSVEHLVNDIGNDV